MDHIVYLVFNSSDLNLVSVPLRSSMIYQSSSADCSMHLLQNFLLIK